MLIRGKEGGFLACSPGFSAYVWLFLAWMVGVAILYGVYKVVFIKPYFKVDTIQVRGDLAALSKEQVIEISGIKLGDHLLRIPVDDAQKKLVENPWIKEAAVHRKLPHMVWIFVKEYTPEAIVRTDSWRYVNRFGIAFKKLTLDDDRNFPIITGLQNFSKEGKDKMFCSKVVELLKVKKLFEASSMGEIYGLSEIHLDLNNGVSIITLNDPMELRLGFGPFSEKINRLQIVYSAMKSRGGIISYVDLNSEGKVVVKYGT